MVVAIIQMRTLKTEVEKGSMSTAIEHGLVSPEGMSSFYLGLDRDVAICPHDSSPTRKGIRLIFLNLISFC